MFYGLRTKSRASFTCRKPILSKNDRYIGISDLLQQFRFPFITRNFKVYFLISSLKIGFRIAQGVHSYVIISKNFGAPPPDPHFHDKMARLGRSPKSFAQN